MRSEHTIHHPIAPFPAGTGLRRRLLAAGTVLTHAARAVLFAIEEAQMRRFLHGLSDKRLSTIGVARAEIPAYARRLVRGEQR